MRHHGTILALSVLVLALIAECVDKSSNRLQDLKAVEKLKPLLDEANIFFWRPQKVGSSTLLSILMSYGYRYNFLPKRKSSSNAYCRLFAKCAIAHRQYSQNTSYSQLESYVMQRVPGTPDNNNQHLMQKDLDAEKLSNKIGYKISLSHEICNLNAQVVAETLACSFTKLSEMAKPKAAVTPVKELFVLRDPLSRAISVYYFWGELFKMKHSMKRSQQDKLNRQAKSKDKAEEEAHRMLAWAGELKLGQSTFAKPMVVHGQRFQYHGQESTAPGLGIAMAYANHTIYRPGMPGPSYTWSLFADNLADALRVVESDRICTVVLERLHESLVVAAHYLKWSLADVVVIKHRKALSSHPKHTSWPASAVKVLHRQLNAPEHGEYHMYNASVAKLDQRIAALKKSGVDVPAEVEKLKALQKRVTEICLDDEYLLHYRNMIKQTGLPSHPSQNKLRDVEEKYVEGGHMFSFNREILMSFDVCGPCEAHALLLSIEQGLAKTIETALPLAKLDRKLLHDNPHFAKCPVL